MTRYVLKHFAWVKFYSDDVNVYFGAFISEMY